MPKIQLYNYILRQLIEWDAETYSSEDFSKLKVLKLLFFVVSLNNELLEHFDRFFALPLGPVEGDILTAINANNPELEFLTDRNGSRENENFIPFTEELDQELRDAVDNAVLYLRNEYPELVGRSPVELVEITHKWFAWRHYFDLAKKLGKKSYPIPSVAIELEPVKFYS